jgi:3-oxoacyl-[acyl-carrier-protein] synthase II
MKSRLEKSRAIVVTGMGAVTPLGGTAEATWEGLKAGRSGVDVITRFDPSGFRTQIAGRIDEVPEVSGEWRFLRERWARADLVDRKTDLLLVAASQAWTQAGGVLLPSTSSRRRPRVPRRPRLAAPERIAVCVGSEGGRKLLEDVAQRVMKFRDIETLEPLVGHLPKGEWARQKPSHATSVLASILGVEGPTRTVATACTSSGGAIAEAVVLLRAGIVDIAVCGGTDSLVEAFMLSGFSLLGALSERNDSPATASRPFDLTRDGFVLSEGAGVLILETEAHAGARGAPILGRVLGAGLSNNAYRVTDSPPDGRGPAIAMHNAMVDACVAPEEIDYINAHGTSTPMNDVSETRGIRKALGDAAALVAVSSNKSMFGHLVAACGVVEVITTLLSLRDGILAPTLNLLRHDPECDLDYVPRVSRQVSGGLGVALSNAFGFGGSNATIAVAHPDYIPRGG